MDLWTFCEVFKMVHMKLQTELLLFVNKLNLLSKEACYFGNELTSPHLLLLGSVPVQYPCLLTWAKGGAVLQTPTSLFDLVISLVGNGLHKYIF